jgi:hypothetical protein
MGGTFRHPGEGTFWTANRYKQAKQIPDNDVVVMVGGRA